MKDENQPALNEQIVAGKIPLRRRPSRRPNRFEVMLDMAQAMWGPVFRELTAEDMARLDGVPYDQALYVKPDSPNQEVLSRYRVKQPQPVNPENLDWPTPEQVYRVHDEMIRSYGGTMGVIRPGTIEAIMDAAQHSRMRGFDRFPTIFDKAAYLMREIINGHPFADGQKRTGLATAFVFLGMNGYALWARNQLDEVHFAVEIAKGHHDLERIAEWLGGRVGRLELGKGNPSLVTLLSEAQRKQITPSCFNCRRFVKVIGFKACCTSCKIGYELTARAVAIAEGPQGQHFEARIGLHKIGEGKEAVERIMQPEKVLVRMFWEKVRKEYGEKLPVGIPITIEMDGKKYTLQIPKSEATAHSSHVYEGGKKE